jgi:hypothetical protein
MSALFCYRRRMRRLTLALVALLVFAEAAHAFRTPSVRSRNRAAGEPPAAPATVRMPDDAKPADPTKADITIEGQPAPAITVAPPKPEAQKPAAAAEKKPAPEAPKPAVVAAPPPPPPAPKPEVIAVPAPTPPKPEVAAVPIPAAPPPPPPAPIVVAPPPPPPAPVVVAPPPPPPAPVVAAPPPPPPAPVVVAPPPAPVVAAPERKPEPVVVLPKPAPPPSPVVAISAKPAAAVGRPDPRLIENIFACFSPGLPNEWRKAWVVVNETGPDRTKLDAKFFYAVRDSDNEGQAFTPCNARAVADSVYSLNDLLTPEQRRWGSARLMITSEGAYELKYDYAK